MLSKLSKEELINLKNAAIKIKDIYQKTDSPYLCLCPMVRELENIGLLTLHETKVFTKVLEEFMERYIYLSTLVEIKPEFFSEFDINKDDTYYDFNRSVRIYYLDKLGRLIDAKQNEVK